MAQAVYWAAVTDAFSSALFYGVGTDFQTPGFEKMVAHGVAGGISSALNSGKFANGAITGAFSWAFNDEMHDSSKPTALIMTVL